MYNVKYAPTIITLCGSTKFKEAYQFMNAFLTMKGHLVFSVAMWSHADKDGWEPSPHQKLHLDRVHFSKILVSSEIIVLDVNNYIGTSTMAEIQWARLHGITVKYLLADFPKWEVWKKDFEHTMRVALPQS